jgi:Rrf2 family transcriptional regulator, nitric oxide-sensitive transcriptional repressor
MRPADIVIGEVVRATEGPAVPAECFGPHPENCVISGTCRLKAVLKEAANAFYAVLDKYTLADLMRNRTMLAQILRIEPARAA